MTVRFCLWFRVVLAMHLTGYVHFLSINISFL